MVAAAARLNDVVANNGARSYSTIEVADVDVVPRIAEVDGLAEAIADRLNRWAVTGISPTADEDHQRETALARAVEAHPQGSPELLVDGYRLRRTSMNLSGPYVKMLLENLDLSWTKPDLASKSEV